jgi:hypothetical protein
VNGHDVYFCDGGMDVFSDIPGEEALLDFIVNKDILSNREIADVIKAIPDDCNVSGDASFLRFIFSAAFLDRDETVEKWQRHYGHIE